MQKQTNYARSIFILLLFICFIIAATVLKFTASVMIPLTMSILLSCAFFPLLKTMKTKMHIPWIVGIVFVVLFLLVLAFTIGNLLYTSIKTIVSVYPKYESRFTYLYELFATTFKIPFDAKSSLTANLWSSLNVRNAVQNFAISLSSHLFSFAKDALMVLLFIIFLLLEIRSFHLKTDKAFEGNISSKLETIFANTINEVTRYISIKFIISLLTGFFVFLGTFVIGMDFPIIWGFLAFVLNFIPNFGSIISGVLTVLFALLEFYPRWGYVIYVAVLMLSVNMILGNFVEPRWEGTDLGLSPFVILVSLAIWGWMWGFVGMILAVPIMVIIKIVCENVSILQPIAVLLGNAPHHEKQTAVQKFDKMAAGNSSDDSENKKQE